MRQTTKMQSWKEGSRKNDASSSEADDSEDLYYDPKDDEGFDENEHILQDVHLDVINYDSFSSDTDDGIDLERRDKLRELRRIGKAKNYGPDKYYFYLGQQFANIEILKRKIKKHSVEIR
ncbi:hypothetical protein Tco_0470952 [Tanacetum coccineum]